MAPARRDEVDSTGSKKFSREQHNGRNSNNNREQELNKLEELTKLLGEIEKKGDEEVQALTRQAREVAKKIEQAWRGNELTRIAQTCNDILRHTLEAKKSLPVQLPQQVKRWADVAAASNTPRPIIRARVDDTAEKTPSEILELIRPVMPQAVAIHKLKSGDIDIRLATQAQRDAVATAADPKGVRLFRKAYLLEVPGVPYTFPVSNKRTADNSEATTQIEKSLQRICGTVKITSLRWLRDPESPTKRKGPAETMKTRGSLIVGVATESEQQRIVRSGLIVGAEHFEARLYDNNLDLKQCYHCGQWGHKQGACAKKAACMQCAGDHDTRSCREDNVCCVNCGKKHRAWQKKECSAFEKYRKDIQSMRMTLLVRSAHIRTGEAQTARPTLTPTAPTLRKRPQDQPSNPDTRRKVGRPTAAEQAARQARSDPSQTILSTQPEQNTQQAEQNDTMEITNDEPQC